MKDQGQDIRHNRPTKALTGPTDVDVMQDPYDDQQNRKLAADIAKAVKKYKTQGGEQTFVIGWRLYPNADSKRFKGNVNTCGCGCGCGS